MRQKTQGRASEILMGRGIFRRRAYWGMGLFLVVVVGGALRIGSGTVQADTRPSAEDRGISGLILALRRLPTIASVLHTAAHPDDESTELLAYLARGEGARVAYLSLNRGEGGQNGIGPELWENLGVIRTEELLAARKLDGAEQYFTRAFDFGFTRSPEETFEKWNREELLGDMVRVIRTMRPLVVVSGFTGTTRDGHGQHQVAGILTPEAIEAAADPSRFPELLRQGLQPWRVLKVYGRVWGGCDADCAEFDVGRFDPVLGRSYAELAADGRSRHRSQDFGMIQPRGSQVRTFPRWQSEVARPAREQSLFEGLETGLVGAAPLAGPGGESLVPAFARIQSFATRALAEVTVTRPEAIAPLLAGGLREVRALQQRLPELTDPVGRANLTSILRRKEGEFSDALVKSLGVVVDALSNTEMITPGESVEVATHLYLGRAESGTVDPAVTLQVPTGWMTTTVTPSAEQPSSGMAMLRGREAPDHVVRFRARVPADAPPTQPYWLAERRSRDQFDWTPEMPLNQPFAPPVAIARLTLTLSGERVTIEQPVEFRFADKTFGEIRRGLKVAPALTLTVSPTMLVLPAGSPLRTREISVEITNNSRQALEGQARLQVPDGWQVEADPRPLQFTRQGEKTARLFRVTPPKGVTGSFDLAAEAEAHGQRYRVGYTPISYPHIETHLVYRPAQTQLRIFDVEVASGLRVGYIMGSGDEGPRILEQLGVDVRVIGPAELAAGDLSSYDTIVLGIRVYEVNEHVIANNNRLLEYVANGGTLIVQYNKEEFSRGQFAPYPVQMQRSVRVTDERAPVTLLVPDHPLFQAPNRIGPADWEGWVQERGLYFLSEWDARFTPLLAAPDDTGTLQRGGQLIATYGKGHYVFTAYAWFRQFPAGVPGPLRLFANLVSLPKTINAKMR
jgi:LmbE family N-acetylglucosaminyl deacetylase